MQRMDRASHTIMFLLLLSCWISYSQSAALPESESARNKTLTIGVLAAYYHWAYRFLPAIIPALQRVEELQLLPGYQIEWAWRETYCQQDYGFRAAIMAWQEEEDLDAMIGPCCDAVCTNVALLTAAWNIPTISPTCVSSVLSDVSQYPTFARTTLTDISFSPIPVHLLQTFGWDRCVIVASSQPLQSTVAKESKRLLEAAGIRVFYHIINPVMFNNQINMEAVTEMEEMVRTIKEEALVIILYMVNVDKRVFLILANDEGMISEGYVYYGGNSNGNFADSLFRPEVDIHELMVGFITIEPIAVVGPDWDQLMQDMLTAYEDPHFQGYRRVNDLSEFQSYAVTLYDAVTLWAHAVNLTLEEGGEPDDGMAVTQNMYNFTFSGLLRPVVIDEKGDRKVDFRIAIIQPGFEFVEIFYWHASNDTFEKTYLADSTDDWSGLYWIGGSTSIPSGVPSCGWENEFCVEEETSGGLIIIVICLGVAATLLLPLTVYAYKRHLHQQEQEEVRKCFLDYDDIHLVRSVLPDTNSEVSSPAPDLNNALLPGETMHGFIGNTEVDVRVFTTQMTKSVEKDLLLDIKMMMNIKHTNLTHFIGVCVKSQEFMVLMESASRGSLHDLIADDQVKLTWDLQSSFLADIIRGLRYMHVRKHICHGHLTSANCVINSRWVCKITNYGFDSLREKSGNGEALDGRELWTAPEILCQESAASQEGDIYSFGIIIQEVLTELGPFGMNVPQLSSSEVVAKVKERSDPPYRPDLDSNVYATGYIDLARQCWHDRPANRPDASQVLIQIADQNGGKLPNLVDSMIKNLEHHTHILEGIVEKRSAELKQEQAVMDTILQELLPASVASELKTRKQVEPEAFDDVTFFFSDIVGFTRVSAQSTPMQIVKMLNMLYSRFDAVIGRYDVYKVATIGDAYVVSSGAPIRNGDQHASEIAAMSLDMLVLVKKFSIAHLPDERLYMRIGLHTGPCVAAVTGIKTPRYLFFGETVDVAARIEAGGEKMKIHMSFVTATILQQGDRFDIDYRGVMEVKGVGSIDTYWLQKRKVKI